MRKELFNFDMPVSDIKKELDKKNKNLSLCEKVYAKGYKSINIFDQGESTVFVPGINKFMELEGFTDKVQGMLAFISEQDDDSKRKYVFKFHPEKESVDDFINRLP